jgi:3-oxoacyl-(acyl-carrier-protein) synthase
MSRITWNNMLLPDFSKAPTALSDASYKDTIQNVRVYEKQNNEIEIPDPRAFRAMSRAAIFLANTCKDAKSHLAPYLEASPYSVGVYCAVENGPIDGPTTVKILDQKDPGQFAEFYRKYRNPKMYLKQLPNLAPAQMGIFMGIQGPMNVYTHSIAGGLHALDHAEWDLKSGLVKAALVCTAHAFDDFLVIKRSRHFDKRCIAEGAAAMLLTDNQEQTNWPTQITEDPDNFFGISDPIINILRSK